MRRILGNSVLLWLNCWKGLWEEIISCSTSPLLQQKGFFLQSLLFLREDAAPVLMESLLLAVVRDSIAASLPSGPEARQEVLEPAAAAALPNSTFSEMKNDSSRNQA